MIVPRLKHTAQNFRSCGDQQIPLICKASGVSVVVQVSPSGEVITILLPVAQNKLSSGDQHTAFNSLPASLFFVQVLPSGEVKILVPPTAQSRCNFGDQQTEYIVLPILLSSKVYSVQLLVTNAAIRSGMLVWLRS